MSFDCRRRFSFWNRRRSYSAYLPVIVLLLASSSTARPQAALGSAKSELDRARHLLETPQWSEASEIVHHYLETHPESSDAHALMGLILYRQHDARGSMAEYLRASESGDLSAFDLRIFALACAAIPDLPEAEKWLQRSLEKNDRDAATWEALGHVRFSSQQYESAIDALGHALQLAPRTVSAEALIGLANERLARPDAAEAAYREAIARQANRKDTDPVPFVGLGRVLLNDNKPADAIPWLKQGAKAAQPSSEAHELLGLAYSKTGRDAEAAVELETAIRLDPNSAPLRLMMGRVYRSLGESAKADAELKEYNRLKESSAQ
jgi:tetratricopeptide (TPR) repeat protein